jgi:hypothetical protein
VAFEVVIADLTNTLSTENEGLDLADTAQDIGYTENENYPHILQELYVNFALELYQVQYDEYGSIMFNYPIAFNPIIQDDNDKLTGYVVNITMDVISPMVTDGRC